MIHLVPPKLSLDGFGIFAGDEKKEDAAAPFLTLVDLSGLKLSGR